MSDSNRSVLQVEFFPPHGVLKTTIRFFDQYECTAKYVSEHTGLKKQQVEDIQEAFKHAGAPGEKRWRKAQQAGRRMREIENAVMRLVLVHMLEHPKPQMACENSDRSFRLVEGEEEHQRLIKIANESKGIWVFVFEADELIEDGKLVSAMM